MEEKSRRPSCGAFITSRRETRGGGVSRLGIYLQVTLEIAHYLSHSAEDGRSQLANRICTRCGSRGPRVSHVDAQNIHCTPEFSHTDYVSSFQYNLRPCTTPSRYLHALRGILKPVSPVSTINSNLAFSQFSGSSFPQLRGNRFSSFFSCIYLNTKCVARLSLPADTVYARNLYI